MSYLIFPVMSRTFTLLGDTSILSANYFPPIELNSSSSYCLGLVGFFTYNSIPNIEKGVNDTFTYNNTQIILPEGSYEISHIENFIKEKVKTLNHNSDIDKIISISANNNSLKVEIKSGGEISFREKTSVGPLLGFSPGRILKPNIVYESDLPVDIIKVSSIRLECNIVTGTYYGDKLSHTLFEFSPSVEPGFAINIEPHNIIYLPINTNRIDNITIKVVDQNNKAVNFRGERIIVRLELKERNGY